MENICFLFFGKWQKQMYTLKFCNLYLILQELYCLQADLFKKQKLFIFLFCGQFMFPFLWNNKNRFMLWTFINFIQFFRNFTDSKQISKALPSFREYWKLLLIQLFLDNDKNKIKLLFLVIFTYFFRNVTANVFCPLHLW